MRRQENASKLVVVFENGHPIEATTGVPFGLSDPKYAVETYVPTPFHTAELARVRREAFEEAARLTQGATGFAELRRIFLTRASAATTEEQEGGGNEHR